tara:strand:+ start:338 stop:574 length:237 start_codon:yes stop_codon:yes gene_type:complete
MISRGAPIAMSGRNSREPRLIPDPLWQSRAGPTPMDLGSVKLEQAPLNNAAGFSGHLSLNLDASASSRAGGWARRAQA